MSVNMIVMFSFSFFIVFIMNSSPFLIQHSFYVSLFPRYNFPHTVLILPFSPFIFWVIPSIYVFLSLPVSSCYLQLVIKFLLSDFPYNLSLLQSQRRSFISPSFHSPFRFESTYVTLHRFAFLLRAAIFLLIHLRCACFMTFFSSLTLLYRLPHSFPGFLKKDVISIICRVSFSFIFSLSVYLSVTRKTYIQMLFHSYLTQRRS